MLTCRCRIWQVWVAILSSIAWSAMLSEAVLCQQESAQTMLKTEPFSWKPASGARSQQVQLLLIRHAFSCANMVQSYVDGGRLKKNLLQDPVLTECGAFRSIQAGKKLATEGFKQDSVLSSSLAAEAFRPDYVLSSSMMRAMETAAYMFPMNVITPVPYISEKSSGTGFDKDNTPDEYLSQMRRLQNRTKSFPKFNGTWALHEDFAGEARKKADWERFLKFMAETFLPNIPKELQEKDPLSIAVVSHSHFIAHVPEVKKLCAAKGFYAEKPENNQVLILPYELQGHISLADNTDLWQVATIPVDPYIGDDEAIVVAKESGIKYTHMEVSRTLKLAAKATCVNPEDVYVKGKPEYLCQKDIGAACEKSISDSIPMIHLPTTQGMLTAAEEKLQKLRDQGDGIDKQGPVMEKIAQLQSFRCCTPI